MQTFSNLLFGNTRQLWNRDIDRLAPDWLLQALSDRTGTPIEEVFQSTLRSYEGWLYKKMRASGTLQWITALKLHHRKFEGYGIQFCPQCLKGDTEPYFRKSWRAAFNTICAIHNCTLHDRCPHCAHAVAFHRNDIRHAEFVARISLKDCHHCGFDLSKSQSTRPNYASIDIGNFLFNLSQRLLDGALGQVEIDGLLLMHHFAKLMFTRNSTVKLYSHLCDAMGVDEITLSAKDAIEGVGIEIRHHVLQVISYLMLDLETKLRGAITGKAVRYSHLKKDFDGVPEWYEELIEEFSDWRSLIDIKSEDFVSL